MKDYSKMSDFEINKWIAIELAPDGYIGINESTRSDSEVVITTENGEGCTKNSYVDYCNNPSDAWPIIVENSISIVSYGVEFSAEYGWSAFYGGVCVTYDNEIESIFEIKCSDKNPLRAAMIVYLMMKDEEK